MRNSFATSLMAGLIGALIVVDGDTVKLDGTYYRLVGFDTPETRYARCAREREMGLAAKHRLKDLLMLADPRLEVLPGNCKYRRKCAHLLIEGEDVGDTLIMEGLAVRYDGRSKRRNWCTRPQV